MKHHWPDILILLLTLSCLASCDGGEMSNDVIAQNNRYVVTCDSVAEGQWHAKALSPTHIVTNYAPTGSAPAGGIVKFRLAFNGRDNELASCQYHYALLGQDCQVTGCVPDTLPHGIHEASSTSTLHLRVDLSAMEKSMSETGHYVTATGDTLYRDEFRGVWVAGNVRPLTWDFTSLALHDDLRLHKTSEPGIYELTLRLHPGEKPPHRQTEWKISHPNANYPTLQTGQNIVDACYNMAIDDISTNLGSKGDGHAAFGTSTRDYSLAYPILLSLSYIDPAAAMEALKAQVTDGVIDRGSKWPITTNDAAWAAAAWEVYNVTGSRQWLSWAYRVLKKTIDEDYDTNFDPSTGLLHGGFSPPSSLSAFPSWMEGKDIYETHCLTNNLLYERAFEILNDMSDELGEACDYGKKAIALKDAINGTLWNERRNCYSPYTYIAAYPVQSPCIDNLGQALGVLWNVADDDRAEHLLMSTPLMPYGIPLSYPRSKERDPLNTSEITSPVIQALWNLAAAKTGNLNMLRRGLGAMYRSQALFCANQDAWNAYTGEPIAPGRDKLGSAAASAAMVFRLYAGMTFLPNGIEFNPVIPVFLKGEKHILNFKYRQAVLDLTITGTGNDIESFSIDGKEGNDNFVAADLKGRHQISIKMRDQPTAHQQVTLGNEDIALPETPVVHWRKDSAQILNFHGATNYRLVVNGQYRYEINDTLFRLNGNGRPFSVNAIVGIDQYAFSYLSQPYYHIVDASTITPNDFIYREDNPMGLMFHYNSAEAGTHLIYVRYANGNSHQPCPLFSVMANGHWQGTLVFPARGENEWKNKGWSNMVAIELLRGDNTVEFHRPQLPGQEARVVIDHVCLMKK